MKKKLFTLLLVFAFVFPVALLFVACGDRGGNSGRRISSFEFEEYYATATYGENLLTDPFGTKVVYSDGTKVSIDEITAAEANSLGLDISATKFNSETNQDEPWDLSSKMTVGNYTIIYSAGTIRSTASLNIQKADYSGIAINVNMNNSMKYGGALLQPSVPVAIGNNEPVKSVRYYYQEKTDDNSYREDDPNDAIYFQYEYSETATCDITPGTYQMYAVIETENYNDIRTALRTFTVTTADVTKNYALFADVGVWHEELNQYVWELVPLANSAYEMEYYTLQSEKLSDYIKNMHDVYICEVDGQGAIIEDEYGPVSKNSIASCYDGEYACVEMASADKDIDSADINYVSLRYSPDKTIYNYVNLPLTLKITKIQIRLEKSIGIWTGESSTLYGDLEYDGAEHHIAVSGMYGVRYYDEGDYHGYYACISYTNAGVDYYLPIYRITNYAQTNAGTYSVVCNVVPSLTNCVELVWTEEEVEHTVTSVNLGTWTISPKYYQTEADILLNNKATDEYRAGGDYTLIYGGTYVVSAENIVATRESQVAADVHPTFASISAWVQDANTGAWVEATNDVTIDNTTHTITIAELCPYTYVELRIAFAIDNSNYTAGSVTLYFYLKQAVQYYSVNGTIYNSEEYVGWKAEYHEASQQNYGKYVSADEQTYLKWADVYNNNTLYYYSDFDTAYVHNTSSDIDNAKTYYLYENDTYRQLRFYVLFVDETNEVEQTDNTVGYDAKEKAADATIGLINIDAQPWASNYGSLYVTQEQVVQNNSDEIDFGKSYYVFDGTNYIRVYLYYSDGNSYVEATNRIDGVSDYYYVLEGVNANEQGLTEEQQPKLFATYYNNLYYYQTIYVQNTSSVLNWSKTYYKHISGDNYVNVYMYYKVGDGYIRTYNAVEGVTDYYFAEDYHYLTNPYLVKFDGNDWVEVSEAREVGQYRTVFKVIMSGNRILVDGEGNYLSEVYYEWEIVNNLTKTKVVSCTPVFEDVNGDALPVTGNVVTISSGENAYLNLNITLTTEDGQPLDVRYVAVVATKRAGDLSGTSYGYQSEDDTGAYYTNVADTYVTRVYFVFVDGEHCMTDASGNVIEYIEFTWQVEVNE